jgi:hypothetical protein
MKKAGEPIWDKLAAAITAHSNIYLNEPLFFVVQHAIEARQKGEDYSNFDPKQARKKVEQDDQELLTLANKMEEVVIAYLACRRAHNWGRAPPPDADDSYVDPSVALRKRSLAWLQEDAQRIRELAPPRARGPDYPHNIGGGLFWDIHVRRQKTGKQRSNARAISIFVQDMAGFMKESTGRPLWKVVAELSDLAFPSAEPFTAEEVQSLCKPTTRAGRKKKPVHTGIGDDENGR